MQRTDFYQQILGISTPWKILKVEFDIKAKLVVIRTEVDRMTKWYHPDTKFHAPLLPEDGAHLTAFTTVSIPEDCAEAGNAWRDGIGKVSDSAESKCRIHDPGQVLTGIMIYDSTYGSSRLCIE